MIRKNKPAFDCGIKVHVAVIVIMCIVVNVWKCLTCMLHVCFVVTGISFLFLVRCSDIVGWVSGKHSTCENPKSYVLGVPTQHGETLKTGQLSKKCLTCKIVPQCSSGECCLTNKLKNGRQFNKKCITHTHTQPFYCWSGICPGPPGSAGTRKVKPRRLKPIWIYWSKR